MQKAIHVISSSSGFIFHRLKFNHHSNNGGISISSSSSSSSSSSCSATRSITTSSLLLPVASSSQKGRRFRPFRAFVTRSESNPDGTSSHSTSVAFQSTGNTRKINFCQWCGGSTKHEIPDGEEKTRAICTLCGKIAYENPKMVVGCLIEHENKVLLCKRNIQPSYGRWTLPAGYMEMGESATEGAIRETFEEAGAEVQVLSPFAQLDIPRIGQVRHI